MNQLQTALVVVVVAVLWLVPLVILLLKGKWKMMLVASVLTLLGAAPIIAWVGAIRLAKPHSRWYRSRYDDRKQSRSRERFWTVQTRGAA